ncbi:MULTISPECIES: RICIN domain-containing protein [Bacillus cereus group]|uniref:RICIN domain-containing protein n=2 Tax=Bacillus TaxID=1386 RepID=UPI000BF6E191|nr:hypothetical protein [Bacillus cereus]PFA42209.1 hypothetical protein CN381_22205 [Bacillus cereus]HDR8446483.1 hypothetical protein [Bacillus cereus]
MIESVRYPLHCIDVEKAWVAPLPSANVILYKQNGNADQQWKLNIPVILPEGVSASSQEVRKNFKKKTETINQLPSYFEIVEVLYHSPINERILFSVYKYEVLIKHHNGQITKKNVNLTIKNDDYYLPIGFIGTMYYSYALIAALIDGRQVLLHGNGSLIERISPERSYQFKYPMIQLNFYNSTCNIYYHDDYHKKTK